MGWVGGIGKSTDVLNGWKSHKHRISLVGIFFYFQKGWQRWLIPWKRGICSSINVCAPENPY